MFSNAGFWRYGKYENGEWKNHTSKMEVINYIKYHQYRMLEDPCSCSCSLCSGKTAWKARSRKAKMRREEREIIKDFERTLTENSVELDVDITEAVSQNFWELL